MNEDKLTEEALRQAMLDTDRRIEDTLLDCDNIDIRDEVDNILGFEFIFVNAEWCEENCSYYSQCKSALGFR
jgi:hypothetical protein